MQSVSGHAISSNVTSVPVGVASEVTEATDMPTTTTLHTDTYGMPLSIFAHVCVVCNFIKITCYYCRAHSVYHMLVCL